MTEAPSRRQCEAWPSKDDCVVVYRKIKHKFTMGGESFKPLRVSIMEHSFRRNSMDALDMNLSSHCND